MAVVRVMYLLELRVRLLEKMLTDFIDGVDVYLSLHRDADASTLSRLQVTANQLDSLALFKYSLI